jgi:hypothetical protein
MGLWLKQGDSMIPVSSSVGSSSDGEHVISGDPKDLATLDLVSEGQLLYDGHSLWLKKDGEFVPVSDHGEHVLTGDPSNPPEELQVGQLLYDGIDGDSGGGVFDGEHVLTGDPNDPPEGWAAGQLLYDGVEDTGGGGGGGDGGGHSAIRMGGIDEYTPTLILEAEEGTGWPNSFAGPADWVGARLALYGDLDKEMHGEDATSMAAILVEDVACQRWNDYESRVHTKLTAEKDLQVDADATVGGTVTTSSIAAPPRTVLSIASGKGLRLDSGGRDENGTAYPFEIVGPLVEMSEDVNIGLCLRVEGAATIVNDLTVGADLRVETHASIGGAVVQGFFFNVAARSAEYIEWSSSVTFGQIQLAGNTVSTTGSGILHYRSNQGYTVESGKRLRTTDGTSFQDAGDEMVANTVAPTGTTYPDGHITVVPNETGGKYRLYIENNTDAARSWVGMWMGTSPITGGSSGVSRSAADVKELSAEIEELEGN